VDPALGERAARVVAYAGERAERVADVRDRDLEVVDRHTGERALRQIGRRADVHPVAAYPVRRNVVAHDAAVSAPTQNNSLVSVHRRSTRKPAALATVASWSSSYLYDDSVQIVSPRTKSNVLPAMRTDWSRLLSRCISIRLASSLKNAR